MFGNEVLKFCDPTNDFGKNSDMISQCENQGWKRLTIAINTDKNPNTDILGKANGQMLSSI